MSLSKAIDTEKLAYYDSAIKTRENTKLGALPISNSMEYVKWYFRTHRDGKVYGVKFAYDANDCLVAAGTKYGANTNLVAQPSTRTVSGRNDYDYINLFKHFDANAHLDENGNTIIDAIRGDKNFSYTGKVDVVCVFAPVYERIYTGTESSTKYLYIEWCDSPREGFTLNKLCKDANGNNKGFYCITKFQAGLIDNVPYASAGLYPWVSGPSYNNCVDKYHARHEYMCAMTMAEWAMIQRIFLMKYGSTNFQAQLNGLTSYRYTGYEILNTSTNKNHIVLSTTNANNLYLNTRIDAGTSATRGANSRNIIDNTEILNMSDDIVVFNDLITNFTLAAGYTIKTMNTDIVCIKSLIDSNTQDIDGNRPSAVFTYDDGVETTDVEVYLNLVLSGTDYILDAVDQDNMSIGCHSAVGDITCTMLTISDNISVTAGSTYVETSIYSSGYSLDICGSDGCWMIGSFSDGSRFASVISGIEILTGAFDVIGNAVWQYDGDTNPHIKLVNNPSLITKTSGDIDTRYTDIGYYTHTNTSNAYVYASDIHYDLVNGGFVMDCGGGSSTKGLCDATYILGAQTSGKYEVIVFSTMYSGANGGSFCAYANNALSNADWTIASRLSLNGVMG